MMKKNEQKVPNLSDPKSSIAKASTGEDHAKSTDYALEEPKDTSQNAGLSLNNPIFEEMSRTGKTRRTSMKKSGPRVMGTGKEKKKNKEKKENIEKGPRFAKRSSSPTTEKTPQNQMSLFDFTSSAKKTNDESIFDFSNAQNDNTTTSTNNAQESVFDFGAADESNNNINGKNEESVFSFADAEPEKAESQASEEKGFSFGAVSDTPNNNSSNNINTSSNLKSDQSGDNSENLLAGQLNDMNADMTESASKSEEGISEVETDFPVPIVDQLKDLQNEVKKISKQVQQARDVMKSAKPAEMLASRLAYEAKREELLSLLDNAINITREAPDLLKERESVAKNELPILQKQKEDSIKQMNELEVLKNRDKQSLDNAKKNSETSISSLNRTYEIQLKAFALKKQQHEQNMNVALNPIADRLAEIEQIKSKHEVAIADLMKKIEEHKAQIVVLDHEYEEKMQVYESTESKFVSMKNQISEEEKILHEQRVQTDAKIRQIEAPYQSLMDSVDKREKQIKEIIKKAQKLDSMISDCRRDTGQCSSAATIVTKLFKSHSETVKKRIATKKRIEEITAKIQQLSQISQPKDDEVKMLKIKLTRAVEIIKTNTERVAQLEADKKSAIAQKNFMGAKQITQQMKEIQDQLQTAQKTVADSEMQISKIESENSTQNSQLKEAREQLDDARYTFLENDFNYFESTIAVLDGLFELSPFGARLLKPLQSLMLSGLNDIERPPKLDPNVIKQKIAELSGKLDKVVADEDYEQADVIQEQINRLNAKLAYA